MQRPRPVLTAASIHGVVLAAGLVLAFLGYNQAADQLSTMSTTIVSVILGAVGLGSHLLAGVQGQKDVTPLASPQTADGTPLVPITSKAAAPALVTGTAAKHAVDEPAAPIEVEPVEIPADPAPKLADFELPSETPAAPAPA